MKKYFIFILAGLVFASGCIGGESSDAGGYTKVSVDEFKVLVDDPDTFVLDVHIPEQTHIKGTDALIPYNKISENLNSLPKNKSTIIALYCRSGSMSAKAGKELASLGYTNVRDLDGGINAWKAKGY